MFKESVLQDKVIIVTGGGTGLGRSMSKYLATLGAKICITSRRKEVIEQTAQSIAEETQGDIIAVSGDVRDAGSVGKVIAKTIEAFGKIDGLINNAAGNFVSPTERLSIKAFEAVIGIVLQGSVNYTLETGKYWIEHKIPGTVLNIITTYAWTGSGYTVPSACAKAGVLALTRSLAVEWGRKYHIRMNAIAPGPFPTKGAWDRLFPETVRKQFDPAARIPLQRVGDHQELANLAAYLMSDYSSYINGEVITIDGGEWLENGGQFNAFRHVDEEVWDQLANMRRQQKG